MAEEKYIIFTVGEQYYGMRLLRINGIEHNYKIVPVPLGADCIKGIIHLRGTVIPVYDLRQKFSIEEKGPKEKQLLVAETHNISMGFEVDNVLGIYSVEETDVNKIPLVVHTEETGYLEGVISVPLNGASTPEIMLTIAVDTIMSEHEYEQISEALESEELSGAAE